MEDSALMFQVTITGNEAQLNWQISEGKKTEVSDSVLTLDGMLYFETDMPF